MNLRLFSPVAVFLGGLLLTGADDPANTPRSGGTIRVWAHQGQETENTAMREIVRAFNAGHAAVGRVELTFFPDFQFTEKIAIAAAAGDLPDVFDIDGPMLARYVDAGLLAPLERWFSKEQLNDFLPTIRQQGTIGGRLYALGAYDSAAVLYYDREMLARAGVTPGSEDEGWTWDEFLQACRRLRAAGIEPVALHMNESADEWFTYAFSPVIWSGGGQLISPDGRRTTGLLDAPANIRALTEWQKLFQLGYAATDPVDPDPFGNGRVAMDWSGHWMVRSHEEKKQGRLGTMPLPHLGATGVAPCGSWCWGLSRRSGRPELAAAWIKWVTDPERGIAPMVRANGAVPARRTAFAAFPEFNAGPYRVFRQQLERHGRPRPLTPFYATLTQRFAAALRDISRGSDPARRLREAAEEIQKVIDRRSGPAPGIAQPEAPP